MTTKLTLTVEKSVIARAKLYARKTGRSLSDLIESYLEFLTSAEPEGNLSPRLRKLVGAVNLPENFDEEKELRAYREAKHL